MRLLITGGSGFIGTNFIELLIQKGDVDFVNFDKQEPLNDKHAAYWIQGDLLNKQEIIDAFVKFNPTHVLHLAARTDTASDILSDYLDNTEGTKNLLEVIEKRDSVKHTIITSTQYVYKSKETPIPEADDIFLPHTVYGISKRITEELTRKSTMSGIWTIIRPTNVWGPWNMRYPNELLRILDKGMYFHPGNADPVKSYAYVKNVVHQIYGMLNAPAEVVHQKVFYVGDFPMNSLKWLNSFSQELIGRNVTKLPFRSVQLLSYMGDVIKAVKLPFPLHSVRFNNMIDDYVTPMDRTISIFGLSNPDIDKNVKETISWIKDNKKFFPYWKSKK